MGIYKGLKTAVAIPKECWRISTGWWKGVGTSLPLKFGQSVVRDSSLLTWDDGKVFRIIGQVLLDVLDAWGPLYGKAMQIWLSRVDQSQLPWISSLGLNRVFSDWPPLSWEEVQMILDREIPRWRSELRIQPNPLGVASVSQVHAATDLEGRAWVVKFLKPQAVKRLTESVDAIEAAIVVAEPLALTKLSKRFIRDVKDLCVGLRKEIDLELERATMVRVHETMVTGRSLNLHVPKLHPFLRSNSVIVMERLYGVKLSDIVSGAVTVDERQKKQIARLVLGDLLVQIFEWGLFHGDPHGGNLILLEDGGVGLYDWGLAGELFDSDRKFIAGILKAVMSVDIERLISVLAESSKETTGKEVSREKIRKELRRLIQMVSDRENGKPLPPLHQLLEAALEGADRVGVELPSGLLLLAKSLVTVEGLSRAIDQNLPFARIAGPVLFRAADPGLDDVVSMVKQVPKLVRRYFRKA